VATPDEPDRPGKPAMNWQRAAVGVIGLVAGLLLLNAGLSLIGEDNEPVLPKNDGRPSRTVAGSVPPATSAR